MDDRRVGLIARALRRRRRWRQVDVAHAAGVAQSTVSRFERGHLDELSMHTVRAILAAVDARAEIEVRWRGGQAEQLVDERHAIIGSHVVGDLHGWAWSVLPEVTFQRFGERGSIDLFAAHEAARAVCTIELKSVVRSYEETQRRLDMKGRLTADIAEERLGWRPRAIGLVLVVEGTTANRDRLSIEPIVRAGLPATSTEVRAWLRAPEGPLRGIWFVRPNRRRDGTDARATPQRVRVARGAAAPHPSRSAGRRREPRAGGRS